MVTELDKAYLAGFIDGEGCIVVSSFSNKNAKSRSYRSMLIISQGIESPMKRLRDLWGVGHIICQKNTGFGNSPKYVWNIYSKDAYYVLSQVLPYLVIKKVQAEKILELQKHIDIHRSNKPLSPDILKYREDIKDSISRLNQTRELYLDS